ncbi:MAG TPA: nucleotidyltransferase family protein [Pseudolabrys sp.]|nr:nucleotidyltransferase family protein [Pseudolabrys sp.]
MFLRLVRHYRVEALAQAALSAAGIPLPDEVAKSLCQRAKEIAHRNLAMAAESARLQGLLDAAGIHSLVLKGVALAQLAYGSIAFKFSQDIDLAVAPLSVDAAADVLSREGYRLIRPASHLDASRRALVAAYGREIGLRHSERPIEVELRWQLVNSPSLIAGIDASSPSQDVALGGALSVRTLCDEDLFAYLCVHGCGHGWSRLQWLADLNAFIGARGEVELQDLYRHARAVGAGPCALIALVLCERLFGREVPADIMRGLRASPRTRLAVALSLDLLTGADGAAKPGDRRFATTRVAVMQWLLGSTFTHYGSTVREMSFRLDDMLAWPLPRPLHLLYPLSRLPLWLWRKFGPAPRSRRETGSA